MKKLLFSFLILSIVTSCKKNREYTIEVDGGSSEPGNSTVTVSYLAPNKDGYEVQYLRQDGSTYGSPSFTGQYGGWIEASVNDNDGDQVHLTIKINGKEYDYTPTYNTVNNKSTRFKTNNEEMSHILVIFLILSPIAFTQSLDLDRKFYFTGAGQYDYDFRQVSNWVPLNSQLLIRISDGEGVIYTMTDRKGSFNVIRTQRDGENYIFTIDSGNGLQTAWLCVRNQFVDAFIFVDQNNSGFILTTSTFGR